MAVEKECGAHDGRLVENQGIYVIYPLKGYGYNEAMFGRQGANM